jgi:ketosteroid isomerase-like protein
MSQKNVEIVRVLYGALNRTGVGAFLAMPDPFRREIFERAYHPELELRQSPEAVFDTAGTFSGYDGYLAAARELAEALGDIHYEVGEAFEAGDKVVFDVVARATGMGSGVPVEMRVAHLWELRDGLVLRWMVYPRLSEALDAAGLSE